MFHYVKTDNLSNKRSYKELQAADKLKENTSQMIQKINIQITLGNSTIR